MVVADQGRAALSRPRAIPARWPAAAGIALYLALAAAYTVAGLLRNDGHFVYAQDDPYIHLSIARTLAGHGVWGISPHEFASASSSPLWTLLLASIRLLGGTAVWWPFALNLAAGVALLLLVQRIARDFMTPRWQMALLAAVVVATPLATLALVGMEHTFQMLLVLAFAWYSAVRLSAEASSAEVPGATVGSAEVPSESAGVPRATSRSAEVPASIHRPWPGGMVLAAVLAGLRYEGLFVVAVVCLLCLWRRRPLTGIALGCAAVLPLALFAWYSVSHGGLILPNSVIMKSGPGRFDSLAAGIAAVFNDWVAIVGLFGRPPQLVVTLGGLLALAVGGLGRGPSWRAPVAFAGIFVATSVLHACLVKLEWFFRYEAYLIMTGIVAIALVAAESTPGLLSRWRWRQLPLLTRRALALAMGLLALPIAVRALTAIPATVVATTNIYQQQYQMGLFLRDHYAAQPVALNDIGAPGYLSSARLVDIVGLASQEVAEARRQRRFDRQAMDALIERHDVQAIVLYESVFRPIMPESWVKVGEWTIPQNVAASEDTVAFFAPDPEKAARLRQALDAFAPRLPDAVSYEPME